MKRCPKCKSHSRHRMKRKSFIRIIPGTKSYACDKCNTHYTWFGIINRTFRI